MKTAKIIANFIKVLFIVLLMREGLGDFITKGGYREQELKFWVLVWIPLFAGYESLISVVISALQKKKPEAEKEKE